MKHPQTGAPNGAGFIQFDSTDSATQAIQDVNGKSLADGSKLVLAFAKPWDENGRRNSGKQFGFRSHRGGEDFGYSRRPHGVEWGNDRRRSWEGR